MGTGVVGNSLLRYVNQQSHRDGLSTMHTVPVLVFSSREGVGRERRKSSSGSPYWGLRIAHARADLTLETGGEPDGGQGKRWKPA